MRSLLSLLVMALCSFASETEGASLNNDEREVLAVDQRWADAELKNDRSIIAATLDDNFVYTDENGTTIDKAGFLGAMRNGSMISQELAPDVVRLHGDTAVIVGTDAVRYVGESKDVLYRYTVIYIKRQNGWRAIAEHLGILKTNN
jgi:ketosteroid isomerase-like protein